MDEETKRKISEAHKGKKRPPFSVEWKRKISEARKGNKNLLGYKFSKKSKRKMSLSHKGIKPSIQTRMKMSKRMKGEKNYFWKGGIDSKNKLLRHGIEFRLWREAVFARDNWTCQKCKIQGNKLHPHHIQNFAQYPELQFAINNGITLCLEHHRGFHKKYGIKNNNKEQLEEFLCQ